jgi:hypothetical protein
MTTSLNGFITASSDNSINGNYITQHSVSFRVSGFDEEVEGTVVNVGDSNLETDELPYRIWANEGSSIEFQYTRRINSVVNGKRYVLTDISVPSLNSITEPVRVTGSYDKTEYSIKFYENNLHPEDSTTVVTINGASVGTNDLPYTYWAEAGSTVVYDAETYVYDWDADLRHVIMETSGPASPFVVSGPDSVTLTYGENGTQNIQVLVVFQAGGRTRISDVTYQIESQPENTVTTPSQIWVPYGSTISFSFQNPIQLLDGREYYLLSVDPTSPHDIFGPHTFFAYYDMG